jgi:drug/metabolite transporter (DMT)-like permease
LSLAAIGFIVALKMTSVANALFLSSCAPLLSALLGFAILGERLRPPQIGAVGLGFCGLAIIVGGGFESGHLIGDAWGLLCAPSFAAVSVCTRLAPRRDFAPAMIGYGVLSAAAAAAGCLAGGGARAPPPLEALSGFSAGFLLMGLGFALFLRGAPKAPAVGQTMLAQTETIFGPVWVWLFFGETPAATILLGDAVILAAVAAMALGGRRPVGGRRIALASPPGHASIAARRARSRKRMWRAPASASTSSSWNSETVRDTVSSVRPR